MTLIMYYVKQRTKKSKCKKIIITHEITEQPFKLEVDFAEISSQAYFVVAPSNYSKSFESIEENSKSIEIIIKELRKLISRFVIPNKIVSDYVPVSSLKLKTIGFDVGFLFM